MILMTTLHRIFIMATFFIYIYMYDEPAEKSAHQQLFYSRKINKFHDELRYNSYFNP